MSVPSSRRKKPSPFSEHKDRWDLLLGKKCPDPPDGLTLHACADRPRLNVFQEDCHPDKKIVIPSEVESLP